jgi:hypothetical protein
MLAAVCITSLSLIVSPCVAEGVAMAVATAPVFGSDFAQPAAIKATMLIKANALFMTKTPVNK